MERLAGRVILLWGWRRWVAATAAGAVASLGLAPFDFPAAGFVAFPVLIWLLDGAVGAPGRLGRLLPAFSTGWWFGFGYFLAGMWWIGAGFAGAGEAWALPLAVLGLPALMALFYGLAALAAMMLWSDGLGRIAALGFAFGAAEWLRCLVFSGIGWNAIGYTAMPVPVLMQAASLIGVFGVGTLAVFVYAAPALLATGRHARTGLALAGLLALAFVLYGHLRLDTQPPVGTVLQARVVQIGREHPDHAQGEAFDRFFEAYLDISRAPAAGGPAPRLILWPATLPLVLAQRPDLLNALGQAIGEDQILLIGALRSEGESDTDARRLYNSIIAVSGGGEILDAADKVRLLPFAESLPFARLLRFAGLDRPFPADYAAGSLRRLLPAAEGLRVLPLIGSEAAIPGITAASGGEADLIVNPADLASFGGTPGPYQHLRQAQIRAVEAGLPLLVAMPAGVSAAIGPDGRILDALAIGARGALDVALPAARSPEIGNIRAGGLTFVIISGMLALLLSIRGRSN